MLNRTSIVKNNKSVMSSSQVSYHEPNDKEHSSDCNVYEVEDLPCNCEELEKEDYDAYIHGLDV